MHGLVKVLFLIVLLVEPCFSGVYKWVDQQGTTHYSESPPARGISEAMELQPPPSQQVTEGSAERLREYREYLRRPVRVQPAEEASVLKAKLTTRYRITLKLRKRVPLTAWLEVRFENPIDSSDPIVIRKSLRGAEKVVLESPPVKGITCKNYLVTFRLFDKRSQPRLLGVHLQYVQARFDLERVNRAPQPLTEMLSGKGIVNDCPVRPPPPFNMVSEFLETTSTGFLTSTPRDK